MANMRPPHCLSLPVRRAIHPHHTEDIIMRIELSQGVVLIVIQSGTVRDADDAAYVLIPMGPVDHDLLDAELVVHKLGAMSPDEADAEIADDSTVKVWCYSTTAVLAA